MGKMVIDTHEQQGAAMTTASSRPADASGTFAIGGDLTVNRLGYGAMQITGPGVWGDPKDPDEAVRVLRRAVELGVKPPTPTGPSSARC